MEEHVFLQPKKGDWKVALFCSKLIPYRIRAVAQLLENFVTSDEGRHNSIALQEMTLACTILLRDGCDLLDVVGRQLQKQL